MNRPDLKIWLILLGSALLAYYLVGPNLKANWGTFDDYEIAGFLGNRSQMPLSEVLPTTFYKTEAGYPGSWVRYRPVYYFTRIAKTALFGERPGLWYLTDLTILFCCLSMTWWLLSTNIGLLGGAAFLFALLSEKHWPETWHRLGVAEVDGAFGLVLYVWAFTRIIRSDRLRDWLLLWVGAVYATGTKENFLFLILPTLWLTKNAWQSQKLRIAKLALVISAAGLGLLVIWAVGYPVLLSHKDQYSTPVSVSGHLLIFLKSFLQFTPLHLVTFGALLTWAGMHSRWVSTRLKAKFAPARELAVAGVILVALYSSQIVFYSGVWPRGMHYDFPGLLAIPLGLYFLLLFIQKLQPRRLESPVHTGLFAIILLALSGQYREIGTIPAWRAASIENVAHSNAFVNHVKSIIQYAALSPGAPVVIVSRYPWDWGILVALEKFLHHYGLANPLALRLIDYEKTERTSAQWTSDGAAIRKWAGGTSGYIPWREQILNENCLGIALGEDVPTGCPQELGVFDSLGSVRPAQVIRQVGYQLFHPQN